MFGSLSVAERRLVQLLGKYGLNEVNDALERLLVYAENYMKAEILEIPDGVYSFDDYIEDDGVIPDRSYRIHCAVMVSGNRLLVDFSGSDQQAAGAINCTYGVTASAAYNAVLQVTNSEVPRNSGAYKPIKVIAPPETVVNVRYPHAEVGGNSEIHGRIVDLILACLSLAIPEKVNASTGGGCCNLLFGGIHPYTGRYYAGYHFDAVGWGANAEADGNDMLNELGGNCRTIPVEIFESKYPWRIDQYSLEQDAAGSGKHRGGFGMRKIFTVLAPEITVSAVMDRLRLRPYGLRGGSAGKNGGLFVRRKGEKKWQTFKKMFGTKSDGKFSRVVLHEGDQVLVISPGGGGFGDPYERDPAAVAEDVREHLISTEKAKADYGLLIEKDGTIADTGQRLAEQCSRIVNDICVQPTRTELHFNPFKERRIEVESGQVERKSPSEENWLYCRLCGQLIPKTYFVVRNGPTNTIFCSDECAVVYFNFLDAVQAGAE
jgi:N-methylhydantoinase B/oxoprolinase/acetone carboxylase alpha subunit